MALWCCAPLFFRFNPSRRALLLFGMGTVFVKTNPDLIREEVREHRP